MYMTVSKITESDVCRISKLYPEDVGRYGVWHKGLIIYISNSKDKCNKLIKEIM